MNRLAAAALSALALQLAPTTAEACGAVPDRTFLHETLPRYVPHNAFVAEVELNDDLGPVLNRDVTARVRRTIQGDYTGETVILRPESYWGCARPISSRRVSGFLIGMPRGMSHGMLVVDPMTALADSEPSALEPF